MSAYIANAKIITMETPEGVSLTVPIGKEGGEAVLDALAALSDINDGDPIHLRVGIGYGDRATEIGKPAETAQTLSVTLQYVVVVIGSKGGAFEPVQARNFAALIEKNFPTGVELLEQMIGSMRKCADDIEAMQPERVQ